MLNNIEIRVVTKIQGINGSVALTVSIECDFALTWRINSRLHRSRGLPSERTVKTCPFIGLSEKWVLCEHVGYPRRPRSFMPSLIVNIKLKYTIKN